jgi:hypothetical protein
MFWHFKKKTPHYKEPRDYHYVFAHHILRDFCAHDPYRILELMGSPDEDKLIQLLWHLTEQRLGRSIVAFDLAELAVHLFLVNDSPTVIVKMPPPEATAEVHFVGMVFTNLKSSAVTKLPGELHFRYFTLECSIAFDGTTGTAFCEWANGIHHHKGQGPRPTAKAFKAAIEAEMQVGQFKL